MGYPSRFLKGGFFAFLRQIGTCSCALIREGSCFTDIISPPYIFVRGEDSRKSNKKYILTGGLLLCSPWPFPFLLAFIISRFPFLFHVRRPCRSWTIRICRLASSQLPSLFGHTAGFRGFNAIDARLSCANTVPATRSFHRPSVTLRSQKLARKFTRGSSNSCPDLSALQISHQHQQEQLQHENTYGAIGFPTYGIQVEAPYPTDNLSVRAGPHKLASAGKRVSNKARGVLGKVRTFHRVAAAKMAHPTIKIDTNVQTTKRGFLEDNDGALDVLDEENEDSQEPDEVDNEGVPPFLCQSLDGEFEQKNPPSFCGISI